MRHCASEPVDVAGIEAAAERALDDMIDQAGEAARVGGAQIMAVEILELAHVEAGRGAADLRQVKPADRILPGDDLLVAMAPAEAQQIVEQGLGEDAEIVAIGLDAE